MKDATVRMTDGDMGEIGTRKARNAEPLQAARRVKFLHAIAVHDTPRFLAVIPAKAEALYNSEAGQSIFAFASKQHGFPPSRE